MGDRICSIPGCDRRMIYVTRGLCKRCYGRARAAERPSQKTPAGTPNIARFEARIAPGENGCWQWVGARGGGGDEYGVFSGIGRVTLYAHRWSYEYHRSEIPAGLEIDHLCRNTLCVNPWHLEPVTGDENRRRAHQARAQSSNPYLPHMTDEQIRNLGGYCKQGHEFTPENTKVLHRGNGQRDCRTCARARSRRASKESRARKRAERLANPSAECKNGHALDAENLIVTKAGARLCRQCKRLAASVTNHRRWGTPITTST